MIPITNPAGERNEGVATHKCVLDPDYHFKVWRLNNGYSYECCDTCGKIFQMEKAPEIQALREELQELRTYCTLTYGESHPEIKKCPHEIEVESLHSTIKQLGEALKEIRVYGLDHKPTRWDWGTIMGVCSEALVNPVVKEIMEEK